MKESAGVPAGAPLISAIRLPEAERVTSGGSSRLTRFLFWAVLLGLVGWGAVTYRKNPAILQELRGADYETTTVTVKENADVALEVSGFVVPYRSLNVSPRIPGAITKLTFEVGQKVKKGELLAELDASSYEADLQQAEAALLASRSRLEEAQNGALPEEVNQARIAITVAQSKFDLVSSELSRAKQLAESTSQAELDQLVSAQKDADAQIATLKDKLKLIEQGLRPERLKAIEAEVKQAEALVVKAKYFLDNTKILSPLDGTVLEKNAEVGEILRPEVLSVSLCQLADMSIMEVEIDVQERELEKVEVGRTCTIIPDAYPDRKYTGKIDRFQPMVIRARGVVRVTLRFDQPDRYLLPDMNVRAIIDNPPGDKEKGPTLWISEGAVSKDGEQSIVYVLEGEIARKRVVELGAKEGRKLEVKSGVQQGEILVLAGGQPLVDGQKIRKRAGK